jgi:hypothetical protein
MEATEVRLKRSPALSAVQSAHACLTGSEDTGIICAHPRRSSQLFVGFSDHRGMGFIVSFSIAVFVFILVIIIVWVSRGRRVTANGELDQQSENTLRDAFAHDSSCRKVAMSSCPSRRFTAALTNVSSLECCGAQRHDSSRCGPAPRCRATRTSHGSPRGCPAKPLAVPVGAFESHRSSQRKCGSRGRSLGRAVR